MHLEALIMDQGVEFASEFQTLCQHRGITPLVLSGNTVATSVTEGHGPMFNVAFEKACSCETPTAETELD